MQTIETRIIPATNTKPTRIKATASGGIGKIYPINQNLYRDEQNHAAAAQLLMTKLDWYGTMAGGHTKQGMVWVFCDFTADPDIPHIDR